MKQDELKKEVLKAQQNGDIASLYVLEKRAEEFFDEDELQAFYANILDLALERLTDALESHRHMDINEVQDFATLRALYEYAMEHYSSGSNADAGALFEVLSGLTSDKEFSYSLKFHYIAAQAEINFDDFLYKIADMDATQKAEKFYINTFTKEAQNLLSNSQSDGSKK
ncbi:MAG: hypothetical protein M0Q24_03205 [Sulfurimonas sp.]|uniref:hypothetical protein n=1 Tax=Sulfurimonas sp. TaxID=2022749 RepID=UPI0025E4ACF8|nr:hypothetical protein [Sulfurimonas sp.]MCK9491074.1 hypothetical protein [Sulfurimonas sp.]